MLLVPLTKLLAAIFNRLLTIIGVWIAVHFGVDQDTALGITSYGPYLAGSLLIAIDLAWEYFRVHYLAALVAEFKEKLDAILHHTEKVTVLSSQLGETVVPPAPLPTPPPPIKVPLAALALGLLAFGLCSCAVLSGISSSFGDDIKKFLDSSLGESLTATVLNQAGAEAARLLYNNVQGGGIDADVLKVIAALPPLATGQTLTAAQVKTIAASVGASSLVAAALSVTLPTAWAYLNDGVYFGEFLAGMSAQFTSHLG